jgi:anti-sigma factor RsiW
MNPDKLFDYLDGKLAPADRTALEEQLMSDAQLRQQFQVAREIHRSGKQAREVIVTSEDPVVAGRGARLGRQIATAAFVLVVLNVIGGLAIIGWKFHKPADNRRHDAAVRQQLEESLGAAGKNALPPPSLNDDEISLSATRAEWDKLASAVTAAAEGVGGSAIREDREAEIIVTASIPRSRAGDFRRQILGPTASVPPNTNAAGETATVQVRIAESAR